MDNVNKKFFALAATAIAFGSSLPAQAQTEGAPEIAAATRLDVASLPVVQASAEPRVGEQVMDERGVIDEAFFVRNRTCTPGGCRVFIADKRTGALIYADKVWTPAYRPTGRGREVIRIRPFSESERPKGAPDDSALETAPSIKRVIRSEKKAPE